MSGTHPTSRRAALRSVDPAFLTPLLRVPGDLKPGISLRVARRVNSKPTAVANGVTVTREPISADTSALVYVPAARTEPSGALVWLFGGGLITGAAAHVNDVASTFAAEVGAVVVVPDYRLAPEHPYPAAIDDCFAALTWTIGNAQAIGVDIARIAVGGESAGGGLAAALAQRAADAGIALRLQMLIAPMLDDRTVARAEAQRRVTVAWSVASNRFGWSSYLGHDLDHDELRPYAVPARRADLRGLAPAWISVGEVDLFHDEDVAYARRLREAAVPCDLSTVPGAHHAFEVMKPDHAIVRRLRSARVEALRTTLAPH